MTNKSEAKAGRISRRSFLKITGAAAGATALTCSGLGYLATRRPDFEKSEHSCGGQKPMHEKILVAYATKAGSTVEVAEAIGRSLCSRGTSADVRPIKAVQSLDGYGAVVIGSAIRMGKWLPEAARFVENHRETLSQVPTAYFLVCLTLSEDTPENRRIVETYLDPVRAIHEPDHIGLFPGRMDYSKLSWLDRQIARMIKAPEGDFRNWELVTAWAEGLFPTASIVPEQAAVLAGGG